eukprot:scpid72460/ scgid32126/ 
MSTACPSQPAQGDRQRSGSSYVNRCAPGSCVRPARLELDFTQHNCTSPSTHTIPPVQISQHRLSLVLVFCHTKARSYVSMEVKRRAKSKSLVSFQRRPISAYFDLESIFHPFSMVKWTRRISDFLLCHRDLSHNQAAKFALSSKASFVHTFL